MRILLNVKKKFNNFESVKYKETLLYLIVLNNGK